MTQRPDTLVTAVILGSRCSSDVQSFKDLQCDQNALAVWNDKETIRRRIYRTWPRDPKGENILPGNSSFGKCTSNQLQFWGSTIWDFFWVHRIPSLDNLITISTSSKLSKWMIDHNEIEHASSALEWAKNELDPHQIFPYPIAGVIEDQEMRIRLGLCGKSMSRAAKKKDGDETSSNGRSEDIDNEQPESEDEDNGTDRDAKSDDGGRGKEDDSNSDADQPINAIFGKDAYPAPWPLVPFSYEAPKIEQRLPLHLLPKKLIVHDPWSILLRPNQEEDLYDWTLTQDKTYVYKLLVGVEGKKRMEEEIKARDEKRRQDHSEKLKKIKNLPVGCDGFMLTPVKLTAGPAEPPIFVVHEIAPYPELVEEAHLYLSPNEMIGEGNHSVVLRAEWEVPRSLLVPDILCHECILEDVEKTLAVLDGEDGSRKDPQWKEKSGVWEMVDKGKPEVTLDITYGKGKRSMGTCIYDSGSSKTSFRYSGPVRIIETNVRWQNAEKGHYCSHVLKRMHLDERGGITDAHQPHPLTARVSLIAKLYLYSDDQHLDMERANYERFPDHFFEHWTGYNIIPPLHEPTPVNAVVPQYYGHYEQDAPFNKHSFLTPILLVEDCGAQVRVGDLNMDDKHECAALVYKFHEAGYLHNSVYARNMLCQKGPLDRPMYQRGTGEFMEDGRKYAYRLIDFGRSEKNAAGRAVEESMVGKLLKHSWYQ